MPVIPPNPCFHLALAPAIPSLEQLEVAIHGFGGGAEEVFELGGWRTTSDDVAVARVAFPHDPRRVRSSSLTVSLNSMRSRCSSSRTADFLGRRGGGARPGSGGEVRGFGGDGDDRLRK